MISVVVLLFCVCVWIPWLFAVSVAQNDFSNATQRLYGIFVVVVFLSFNANEKKWHKKLQMKTKIVKPSFLGALCMYFGLIAFIEYVHNRR